MRLSRTLLLIAALLLPLSLAAQTITGIVTNKTNNKPAPGDDVVLLKLAQGMQELARTKTDAKGRFSIDIPESGLHLLRVTHDKANYFRPIQPGAQSVEIEVYTAAPQVQGITLDADVVRIQTEAAGNALRVVEHFFIKNESSPAKTLMSDHPFELYLPTGATVEGTAAKAPGGMAVQSGLVPEPDPNKYTIIFPIRPGETEFQITYRLPYKAADGYTFNPRPVMTTDNLVVMLPKSINFKQSPPNPYVPVTEEASAQTYVVRQAQPSQPLSFTISGQGELPRDSAPGATSGTGVNADPNAQPDPNGTSATNADPNLDHKPGIGLGTPLDKDAERSPLTKYRWWILGGLAVALAAAAGVMLRTPRPPRAPSRNPPSSPATLPPAPYKPFAMSSSPWKPTATTANSPTKTTPNSKKPTTSSSNEPSPARPEAARSFALLVFQKTASVLAGLRSTLRNPRPAGRCTINRARRVILVKPPSTGSHHPPGDSMQGFLRFTQLLTITLWVGGIAFFAFVLAPVAFHTLPTIQLAGLVVGQSLRVFDVAALTLGILFLAVTAALFAQAPMRIRGRYEMQFLFTIVMLLATAYIHFNILPSMDADQSYAHGDIATLPSNDAHHLHFDKLHTRSERVEGTIFFIGLATLFLMSREQHLTVAR